jgi:hypothetical protein
MTDPLTEKDLIRYKDIAYSEDIEGFEMAPTKADPLIEKVARAIAMAGNAEQTHCFEEAQAAIAAVHEWQDISTAFDEPALSNGYPFLAVKRPFDPQIVHIEGEDIVRFESDGSVTMVDAEKWTHLPRPKPTGEGE